MKRFLSVFLAILLLFTTVSILMPGVSATAAAGDSSNTTVFDRVTQSLRTAFLRFFEWLRSLFSRKTAPEEIEIDTPPETSAAPTTTTAPPESDPSVICDSRPSDPTEGTSAETTLPATETLAFRADWEYASFSAIHTGSVTLYRSQAAQRKGRTVCVNAGHGTKDGDTHFTLCHPDGSPKVTGGSTAAGAIQATAVGGGTTMLDGTPEAQVTLSLALLVKEKLLAAGYDVLMIRESDDVQLDNIARTVFANNCADCHIALHYDSSTNDKGLFYCGVPDVESYRNMEPVKSHFEAHTALGEALLQGARDAGVKIYRTGRTDIDLTQTSYSTVPSVDLEVGDRGSDCGAAAQGKIADGIVRGVNAFFG